VRTQLLALYDLKSVDSEVLEVERQAAEMPSQIEQLERQVEVVRLEVGQLNTELEAQIRQQTEIEGQISEESAKHQKWKRRLMDIRSPREYQAMSREIETGERQVRELEEHLLALMADTEQRKKVVDERHERLKGEEDRVRQAVEVLREKERGLTKKAEEIRRGRERIVSQIEPQLLKRYEQIRKARKGVGVALLKDGACLGCQMKLRPQHLVEILRFESVEQCPTCQRILAHEVLLADRNLNERPAASPPLA
jgi:uncharacterized protein